MDQKRGLTEEQLKAKYSELEEVEVPNEVAYLKQHFNALSNTRQEGMSGPGPITFLEMKSYLELTENTLSPWDIETIRFMDVAFLEEIAQLNAKDT